MWTNLLITLVGVILFYFALIRPWHLHWGATQAEIQRALPGDEVISGPMLEATRALSIGAPASRIWPWLVQMGGYSRAGWYSYDWIDNAGKASANHIIPELQNLKAGDIMPTAPDGSGFVVQGIEANHCLVLVIHTPNGHLSTTIWLEEATTHTRMIFRLRLRVKLNLQGLWFLSLMDFGDFVMMRKQMLGIKARAEHLELAHSRRVS